MLIPTYQLSLIFTLLTSLVSSDTAPTPIITYDLSSNSTLDTKFNLDQQCLIVPRDLTNLCIKFRYFTTSLKVRTNFTRYVNQPKLNQIAHQSLKYIDSSSGKVNVTTNNTLPQCFFKYPMFRSHFHLIHSDTFEDALRFIKRSNGNYGFGYDKEFDPNFISLVIEVNDEVKLDGNHNETCGPAIIYRNRHN